MPRTAKKSAAKKAAKRGRKPGPKKGGARRGRKPSGRVKKPFSIVLDEAELRALKEIARKRNSSVAGLIRGAMNAVIFQANPKMARTALEKDVDDFLEDIKGKLPMKDRFEGKRRRLKKSLVEGIISDMEKL